MWRTHCLLDRPYIHFYLSRSFANRHSLRPSPLLVNLAIHHQIALITSLTSCTEQKISVHRTMSYWINVNCSGRKISASRANIQSSWVRVPEVRFGIQSTFWEVRQPRHPGCSGAKPCNKKAKDLLISSFHDPYASSGQCGVLLDSRQCGVLSTDVGFLLWPTISCHYQSHLLPRRTTESAGVSACRSGVAGCIAANAAHINSGLGSRNQVRIHSSPV